MGEALLSFPYRGHLWLGWLSRFSLSPKSAACERVFSLMLLPSALLVLNRDRSLADQVPSGGVRVVAI